MPTTRTTRTTTKQSLEPVELRSRLKIDALNRPASESYLQSTLEDIIWLSTVHCFGIISEPLFGFHTEMALTVDLAPLLSCEMVFA
jgi:hypothetical protein